MASWRGMAGRASCKRLAFALNLVAEWNMFFFKPNLHGYENSGLVVRYCTVFIHCILDERKKVKKGPRFSTVRH